MTMEYEVLKSNVYFSEGYNLPNPFTAIYGKTIHNSAPHAFSITQSDLSQVGLSNPSALTANKKENVGSSSISDTTSKVPCLAAWRWTDSTIAGGTDIYFFMDDLLVREDLDRLNKAHKKVLEYEVTKDGSSKSPHTKVLVVDPHPNFAPVLKQSAYTTCTDTVEITLEENTVDRVNASYLPISKVRDDRRLRWFKLKNVTNPMGLIDNPVALANSVLDVTHAGGQPAYVHSQHSEHIGISFGSTFKYAPTDVVEVLVVRAERKLECPGYYDISAPTYVVLISPSVKHTNELPSLGEYFVKSDESLALLCPEMECQLPETFYPLLTEEELSQRFGIDSNIRNTSTRFYWEPAIATGYPDSEFISYDLLNNPRVCYSNLENAPINYNINGSMVYQAVMEVTYTDDAGVTYTCKTPVTKVRVSRDPTVAAAAQVFQTFFNTIGITTIDKCALAYLLYIIDVIRNTIQPKLANPEYHSVSSNTIEAPLNMLFGVDFEEQDWNRLTANNLLTVEVGEEKTDVLEGSAVFVDKQLGFLDSTCYKLKLIVAEDTLIREHCVVWNEIDFTRNSEQISSPNIDLHVFPNPSRGKIELNVKGSNENIQHVKVINGAGQVVLSKSLEQAKSRMVLDLPTGNYILVVNMANTVLTKPIIIEK